jgi:hypothetical protein
MARSGNTLYLTGGFTSIGPYAGGGAEVSVTDGAVRAEAMPQLRGEVRVTVPDGKGGWFVGGNFTAGQDPVLKHLVHVLPDYTLDVNFDFQPDAPVQALTLVGDILYVGGRFVTLGGQPRSRLAAIHVNTRQLTGWDPGANGPVRTLLATDSTVYCGGDFTAVGGLTRNRLAALRAGTGRVTDWHPDLGSTPTSWESNPATHVNSLAVAGGTLFVGGKFTTVGGLVRRNCVGIDRTSGLPIAWASDAFSPVHVLRISGSLLYVGGEFQFISGQYRNYLAAINTTTGALSPWYPKPDNHVKALAVVGNTLYAGGSFEKIDQEIREYVAAFDAGSGALTPWQSSPDSQVGVLAAAGGRLFVGGDFKVYNGIRRNHAAAIDLTTNQVLPWNPNLNVGAEALVVTGDTVYIGGGFSTIGGQPCPGLAAVDATSGTLLPWRTNISGGWSTVHSLALGKDRIYVGGDFTSIGGRTQYNLGAFTRGTGQTAPWNAGSNKPVRHLAVANQAVFAAGNFTTISGIWSPYLVALDATTGSALPWNLGNSWSSPTIETMASAGNTVYIGGHFFSIGGQSRTNAAAINAVTGQFLPWNPLATNPVGTDNVVEALAVADSIVYLGGGFTFMGVQPRHSLAAVHATTGQVTAWQPDVRTTGTIPVGVSHFVVTADKLYTAAIFDPTAHLPQRLWAALDRNPSRTNWIKGRVFNDANANCTREASEKGLGNIVVVAEPGPYYALTDTAGNYTIAVDSGRYAVRQVLGADRSRFMHQVCPADGTPADPVVFTGGGETRTGPHFGNRVVLQPFLSAGISTNRRRRCAPGITVVSYQNQGTAPAENVQVHLQFPPHVVLVSAGRPYTVENGHYVFNVGTLPPNGGGLIAVDDSVVCGLPEIRGFAQCTKVWLTPGNPVPVSPEWDQSDVAVKAAELPSGNGRLVLRNAGSGDMGDSTAYRIYFNARLVRKSAFRLAAGDSLVLEVPGQGRTIRLEADQRPHHPRKRQSFVTLEGCGTDANGQVSLGFVTQLPTEEEEPEAATECLPITDSFDPNDKQVLPAGVQAPHYTAPAAPLRYTIRFQNTGTDYAEQVVVVDTLASHLDVGTLRLEGASHPYKFSVSGKGKAVLTWTFANIHLPDSTRDEKGSHGFIRFTVTPSAGTPLGTRVENFADIFFDYNLPVRTNTVFNTLDDRFDNQVDAAAREVVLCQANPAPDAAPERIVCEQDTVLLQARRPSYGQGAWKTVSGSGQVTHPDRPVSDVTRLAYGPNVFEWRYPESTCPGDSLRFRVTIVRTRRPAPPSIVPTGKDSLSCAVAGEVYQWFVDGTALPYTSRGIPAAREGKYTVRVGNQGCFSDASEVFAFVVTGLRPVPGSSGVKIYPNPTSGLFTLDVPAGMGRLHHIAVFNLIGKKVWDGRVAANAMPVAGASEAVDLSAYPPGTYFIQIRTSRGVAVGRVVKQ